jgi:hypothetical protein
VRCHHLRPTPAQRATAERRARAAIELRRGRAFTDDEWRVAKRNLRQLFGLLASWQVAPHVVVGASDENATDD